METKEILLTPGAASFLGHARDLLAKLDRMRAAIGVVQLKKAVYTEGVTILLTSSDYGNKIIMWGGGFPLILFANDTDTIAYDYYGDVFTAGVAPFLGDLAPIFNGRCQFGVAGHNTYRRSWSGGDNGEAVEAEYIGGMIDYETAAYSDGETIYRQDTEQSVVAAFEHNVDLAYADHDGAHFPTRTTGFEWNQNDTTVFQKYTPRFNSIDPSFKWTPSFFFSEPGTGVRVTGWFYGSYDGSWVLGDGFEPIGDGGATAQLVAMLEVRDRGLQGFKHGYCEALTYADIGIIQGVDYTPDFPVLTFFASPEPFGDGGNQWFGWRSTVLLSAASMWGGTTPQGNRDRLFELENPFGDGKIPEVHFWAFTGWWNPDTQGLSLPIPPDSCGLVIVQGQRAKIYKYHGGLYDVFETEQYHSHSTSPDGTILAVFEQAGGVISTVSVFDLYGAKAIPTADYTLKDLSPTDYQGGAPTTIRLRVDCSRYAMAQACVIPYRRNNAVVAGIDPDAVVAPPAEQDQTTSAAWGGLNWQRDSGSGLIIWKMVVTGGVYASIGRSYDECLDSTVYIEPPTGGSNDHLVVFWASGDSPVGNDLYNGKVRGSFVGDHANMRFRGEAGEAITNIIAKPIFSALEYEDGSGVFTQGGLGETTVTGPNPPPEKTCESQTYTKWTVTTSCGQSAIVTDTVEPFGGQIEISLQGEEPIGTGAIVWVTGGLNTSVTGPWEQITPGIYSYDGSVTCSSDSEGLAVARLLAKDECDNEVEAVFRVGHLGASWKFKEQASYTTVTCNPNIDPGCPLVCLCWAGGVPCEGFLKIVVSGGVKDEYPFSCLLETCIVSTDAPKFPCGSCGPGCVGIAGGRIRYEWKC